MQFLGEKYGFKILETYCNDDFATGLLTFETFIDSYKFCRENIQCGYLEFKHMWYETYSGKITTKLLNDIKLTLNQDCIDEIAKRLDVVGLADLLSVCKNSSLDQIAGRRFSNLIINQTSVGSSFGLMNLCYVLHLMGDIVKSIIISLHSFRGGTRNKWNQKLKYSILYNVCYFTGPHLKSITLEHFELDVNDLNFRSLMNNLQARNVVITTNWFLKSLIA